jgi:hypothetical protein
LSAAYHELADNFSPPRLQMTIARASRFKIIFGPLSTTIRPNPS